MAHERVDNIGRHLQTIQDQVHALRERLSAINRRADAVVQTRWRFNPGYSRHLRDHRLIDHVKMHRVVDPRQMPDTPIKTAILDALESITRSKAHALWEMSPDLSAESHWVAAQDQMFGTRNKSNGS